MDITAEQLKNILKESIQETLLQQKAEEKATMTIQECSEFSGIGRDKLMELAHGNNDFPSFKVGAKFLINRQMFIAWLEKVTKEGRTL